MCVQRGLLTLFVLWVGPRAWLVFYFTREKPTESNNRQTQTNQGTAKSLAYCAGQAAVHKPPLSPLPALMSYCSLAFCTSVIAPQLLLLFFNGCKERASLIKPPRSGESAAPRPRLLIKPSRGNNLGGAFLLLNYKKGDCCNRLIISSGGVVYLDLGLCISGSLVVTVLLALLVFVYFSTSSKQTLNPKTNSERTSGYATREQTNIQCTNKQTPYSADRQTNKQRTHK